MRLEGERARCLNFCRDTITRLADRANLQKAQIETLLADRVREKFHVIQKFFLQMQKGVFAFPL